MDDRFNTPHTDKIEVDFLGHRLQLLQDPNSKHLGTTIWDASMVFAKFLERNCKKGEFSNARLAGKRVIEVGAGCGLAGLSMALLGCNVIATDQIEVLPLLLRNLERNMARAKHSTSESPYLGLLGTIEVAELDWGNQGHIEALSPPFDYIIGSDIIYKEQLLEPLFATFLALAGPKTSILLAYEFRSSNVHDKMLQLWKENFNTKRVSRSKMDPIYQHSSIHLFYLKPKMFDTHLSPTVCSTEENEEVLEHKMQEQADNALPTDCHKSTEASDTGGREESFAQDCVADGAASCSDDPKEWEIRRLGSMAARLLQDSMQL